jgi:hypothetical protein
VYSTPTRCLCRSSKKPPSRVAFSFSGGYRKTVSVR